MMKAIRITAPGKVELTDLPRPQPGRGEVLLKIIYVGFCGAELSTFLGKNPMVSYPRIPGHEIGAVVAETGDDVPDHIRVGDRVTVVPYTSCGKCASCRKGRFNACQYNQTLGVQRDGAMSEYFAVPFGKLLKVPSLSGKEAALVEPLTVGFHAVDRASVSEEDVVMVMGSGMIGAGAVSGASARGAQVIAVDIDDDKLETARKIGADFVINSRKKELAAALNEILDGEAPDVVVEAAGNRVTYRAGIEQVAFSGRMVCIGYAKEDISFPTKLWVQKELDILGSRNATPGDFEQVINMLEKGGFPVDEVITKVVDPEDAPAAFSTWAENPGKVFKIMVRF
jgi:2-desacetyl-2-hydroxyethyl bacteriochlorophyllide A dehydrogenase